MTLVLEILVTTGSAFCAELLIYLVLYNWCHHVIPSQTFSFNTNLLSRHSDLQHPCICGERKMKMKKRNTVSEAHLETSALDMSAELKINGNYNLNNQDI